MSTPPAAALVPARSAARWIPALNWGLCTALAIAGAAYLSQGTARPATNDLFAGIGGGAMLLMSFAFATVGAILARRIPRNAIGWVLSVTGLTTALGTAAYAYADHALRVGSPSLHGAATAVLVQNVLTPLVAGLLALSLLLFPDGRLPSRRWAPALAATLIGMIAMAIGGAFRPGHFDQPFATASNPLGVPGSTGAMNAAVAAAWALMWAGLIAATISARRRLHGAVGRERAQLKLVLAGGAVIGTITVLDITSWFVWTEGHEQTRMAVIGGGFTIFPIVIGVAILRHRLFDIDVVINRALVYAALTATLAMTYLGTVLLLQLALSAIAGTSGIAVAGSTLTVAGLFRPARARIQEAVDRRFYRSKYDAQHALEAFATRLRDEVDLATLDAELTAVVRRTLQPTHVSLSLLAHVPPS